MHDYRYGSNDRQGEIFWPIGFSLLLCRVGSFVRSTHGVKTPPIHPERGFCIRQATRQRATCVVARDEGYRLCLGDVPKNRVRRSGDPLPEQRTAPGGSENAPTRPGSTSSRGSPTGRPTPSNSPPTDPTSTPTGDEPARAYPSSNGATHILNWHLGGNERTDRGAEQPDQGDQTSSVRVPELRQLPNRALPYAGKPNWKLLATVTPPRLSMGLLSMGGLLRNPGGRCQIRPDRILTWALPL